MNELQVATKDEKIPITPAPRSLLMADAGVIRAALMDVIDAGDPTRYTTKGELGAPWLIYDLEEDYANTKRGQFADAVEQRIRELQATPHNLGIKLGNYCVRHLGVKLGLPEPSVLECVDCKTERLRQG